MKTSPLLSSVISAINVHHGSLRYNFMRGTFNKEIGALVSYNSAVEVWTPFTHVAIDSDGTWRRARCGSERIGYLVEQDGIVYLETSSPLFTKVPVTPDNINDTLRMLRETSNWGRPW